MTSVANSADEMGNAVSEISQQVNHATKIAASAVSTAQTTNETMEKLSVSAEKVGQVVSLISDIAAQTNLLALNATIESARAGEAEQCVLARRCCFRGYATEIRTELTAFTRSLL